MQFCQVLFYVVLQKRGDGLKKGKIGVTQRVIDTSMKKPMAIPIPRVTKCPDCFFLDNYQTLKQQLHNFKISQLL